MNKSPERFPIGASITVEQMAREPYPIFQQMLAHEPVSWVPAFNFWMITPRDSVIEIMRDAELYTMESDGGQLNPMEDTFGQMMLSLDGQPHKRIRDIFVEPYRPKHSRQFYTGLVEEIAKQIIVEIEAETEAETGLAAKMSGSVDLDKRFSDRLAVLTVVATLGFSVDNMTQFRSWYDDFAAAIGNVTYDPQVRQRGKAAMRAFYEMVTAEVARLRARPNDSVLSQIVHDQRNDLTLDEIAANVALTFFGGVETTAAMLSNTLWGLLTHPEQLAAVRNNWALLPAAIEEGMRWESPVQAAMRFPLRNVEWHGVKIDAGEKIYCMLGAANRDPAFFTDPDRFDVFRPNASKHLGFAFGPHFCLGAPLARLEGKIGLRRLLERFPNLALDNDRPSAPYGHEFRSTPTLYARLNGTA